VRHNHSPARLTTGAGDCPFPHFAIGEHAR
jgi:hypothetical protein